MGAAKIMARDLVRTRAYIQKFYKMKAELQAVSMRIITLKSTAAMSDAMRGATKAMMVMNKQVNIPQMQRILMEFEKQSETMDMKEEMMADATDDVMAGDDEEEETEQVVNQVLDEIGISLGQELADTPSGTMAPAAAAKTPKMAAPAAAAAAGGGGGGRAPPAAAGGGDGDEGEDEDLEARLNRLKKT
jgi:charged multivesicular body protein 2A